MAYNYQRNCPPCGWPTALSETMGTAATGGWPTASSGTMGTAAAGAWPTALQGIMGN